ncbi:MAG: lipoate--protein ligase family protein [Synechococcaceae cyanobacterium RL_1_2]|nr:lipoate--protein ligase family protein [Synechococcaceae cyanobacterium RL_1_2]
MFQPSWRLLLPINTTGSMQMAIDRWLLSQGRPCLRFYQWHPPAISLGYHQQSYPEHWSQLGLELVRRPTGGRAVLHQGDLTYSLITPLIPGSRQEVYNYLCGFLLTGWRSLGVNLGYGQRDRGYLQNPSCFNTGTSADLMTEDGYKLIGSAQLKTNQGYLQHGSMVLRPDRQLFHQVFKQPCPYAPHDYEMALDLLIEKLTIAAELYFKVRLVPEPLYTEEWSEIKKLTCQYHIEC